MGIIKGNGAPTRKTLGALGDIYIDSSTGKRYKCMFAYRSDSDNDFDCEWKEMKKNKVQTDSLYGETKEEPRTEPVEETKEEPKTEPVEETKEEPNKRTDYSAFSKKNR